MSILSHVDPYVRSPLYGRDNTVCTVNSYAKDHLTFLCVSKIIDRSKAILNAIYLSFFLLKIYHYILTKLPFKNSLKFRSLNYLQFNKSYDSRWKRIWISPREFEIINSDKSNRHLWKMCNLLSKEISSWNFIKEFK